MKLEKPVLILGVALFVSLVGNLFMGGMLLGHQMGPSQQSEWQARTQQVRAHLSEKDEKILKNAMRDNQKQFEEMRKDLEDIRQDIKAASHAEPFDQETLDAALREEKQKKMEILKFMQETRQEVLQKLSPEGVQILQRMKPAPRFSVRRTVVPMQPQQGGAEVFLWEEWDDQP